jgi:hypothetical protein
MNLTLAEAVVKAKCLDLGVRISAIETLPSGGTHLVCVTSEDADLIRHKLKDKLIDGKVRRFAFMHVVASKQNDEF